jgi:hypothetical protein
MSLDFYLSAMRPTSVFSGNATHNLTAMWREAGVYDALYMSEGKTAGEILHVLREGLSRMRRHPEVFEALNPANGWGNYEVAVSFLEDVVKACDTYPDATVGIWK